MPVVFGVTDVLVSPSSVVAEMCEGVSLSSFSKKRSIVWVENQEEMSYEGTPVKAPPTSSRRMMPPTPQQSSHSSIENMQWQSEMEVQGSWNARERTVREWNNT